MAQALQSTIAVKPKSAQVTKMTVAAKRWVSKSFIRVTLVNDDPTFTQAFEYLGHDHWFRLFLPNEAGLLNLPYGDIEGWYSRHLAIPEKNRSVVRNYTICAARATPAGWEFDVDFVIHRSSTDEVEGIAAHWAVTTQPGEIVGFLDQGALFNPGTHRGPILVISDESGLPGVDGISKSRGSERDIKYLLEVPDRDDIRDFDPIQDVTWLVRQPGEKFGEQLIKAVEHLDISTNTYAYVVGEGGFVLRTRALLAQAGIPKDQLHFCAYWRPIRRAKLKAS